MMEYNTIQGIEDVNLDDVELPKKTRRPKKTTEEKIELLKKAQAKKKENKKLRILSKKTGKMAKKNTLAVPVNLKKLSEKGKKMIEDMQEEIVQKDVTDYQIKKALDLTGGNLTRAADMLKLHYSTLFRKVKNDPEIIEYLDIITQKIVDKAQQVIMDKLEEGNERVALFVLETKGKNKGYHKKIVKEVVGKNGGPVEINNTMTEAVKKSDSIISKALGDIEL